MRGNVAVQKKCLWCGHIYKECDRIFGVAKCPQCFVAEKYVYVDRKDRVVTRGSRYYGDCSSNEWRRFIPDDGCAVATDFLGKQSKCLSCPFPECVLRLSKMGREIVLGKKEILEVYKLYDMGLSGLLVAKILGRDVKTVADWLNKRKALEPIYNDWGQFIGKLNLDIRVCR